MLFCQRLEVFLLGRFAHFIILLGKLAVGGLLSRVCLSLDALNSIERSLRCQHSLITLVDRKEPGELTLKR